jgi:D-alanyl-lipoteichoic acid acyltransferase DltB (MBOAT superfamily)
MSYALDVYYKRLRPCEQFKDFLLYVTFFPQLVAGPILRAQNFIPQISSPFCYRDEHFFKGVFFILVGLIKKTVIADSIGILLVDPIYSNSHHPTFLESLVATYGYAFQIYNDFSGYSDLAIGSALIFGFQVPINFDRPFSCNNPSDFWNRWHISLSHWVRDYLFYPMMMNGRLKNKLKTNLFLTTLIIGIWHGANWTFLIFGLWHGMIAIVHMAIKPITQNLKKHFLWSFFSWIIYFHLIMIGMLIFRAQNLTHLQQLWDSIIGFDMSFKSAINNTSWVCITFTLAIFSHLPRAHQWDKFAQKFVQSKNILKIIVSFACLCAIYLSCQILQGQAAFIYFRF